MIGRDLEFIASLKGMEGWTIPQCLNFLLLEQIRPARRAAVVGTMRDDGIYTIEWIAYHLALTSGKVPPEVKAYRVSAIHGCGLSAQWPIGALPDC